MAIEYVSWGDEIEAEAKQQMRNACELPISRAAALMPDAHVGYGLPIGGVLATKGGVIPYAVGVDIACRVMVSVLDEPLVKFFKNTAKFERALEECTYFGIGARTDEKLDHPVMDENWNISSIVASVKNTAWGQLGTSGSGNHFVEFGVFEVFESCNDLEPGNYLAVVSHSGSRGAGARIADHYSRLAKDLHPELPNYLQNLAWLDMPGDGEEYWAAMELMGKYASANHHIIHDRLRRWLGAKPIFQIENHHNFAWKETYNGEEYIVHRKGATPAGKGVLGYIPGTMADPGYLVEGLGNPKSLDSSSHGAGRRMSRKQARNTTTRNALKKVLSEKKVQLISAGLDESPHAYKNIESVMHAQNDLVRKIARFSPRLVKMAPDGEKPED